MQWDINNEMLHGSFFADRDGVAIRDWMYQAAAQADPDVDLFINDFDVVENGQLTQVNIYTIIIHSTRFLFSDWPKASTVNFRNQIL